MTNTNTFQGKIPNTIVLGVSIAFFIASLSNVIAQSVGINASGSAPDASAMLDISSSSKGLLIPRIALSSLTDNTTVTNPATSLLVYSSGGAVPDGYYYNSGTPASPVWSVFYSSSNNGNCFTNWQLFNANGNYTVPAGVTKIKVIVWGGGGGGATSSGIGNRGGGGGGGGGYAEGIYSVTPSASYTVIVGAGGTAGNNGGTTSFGSPVLIQATGGTAGYGTGASAGGNGGAGGIGSGGFLNSTLGSGGSGGYSAGATPAQTNSATNGAGGGGAGGVMAGTIAAGGGGGGIGGGNGGGMGSTSGQSALANTGAGGGGSCDSGTGGTGGSGADGKVIVFW